MENMPVVLEQKGNLLTGDSPRYLGQQPLPLEKIDSIEDAASVVLQCLQEAVQVGYVAFCQFSLLLCIADMSMKNNSGQMPMSGRTS